MFSSPLPSIYKAINKEDVNKLFKRIDGKWCREVVDMYIRLNLDNLPIGAITQSVDYPN
jgi:hypothetical protein